MKKIGELASRSSVQGALARIYASGLELSRRCAHIEMRIISQSRVARGLLASRVCQRNSRRCGRKTDRKRRPFRYDESLLLSRCVVRYYRETLLRTQEKSLQRYV